MDASLFSRSSYALKCMREEVFSSPIQFFYFFTHRYSKESIFFCMLVWILYFPASIRNKWTVSQSEPRNADSIFWISLIRYSSNYQYLLTFLLNWYNWYTLVYIWTLQDSNKPFQIKWKVLKKCKAYSNISKKCNLCLYEKFIIICKKELCSLNRRNELASSCPHRNRYVLQNSRVT